MLSSAAMMDDVVGLVMVQVISNLGESRDSFGAVTVVRPLAVSVGLAIAVPLICRFIALPLTGLLNGMRESSPGGMLDTVCRGAHTAFIIHTLILIGLVTGATYAGTSNLFAAYLAGASVSWWDSEVPHVEAGKKIPTQASAQQDASVTAPASTETSRQDNVAADSARAEATAAEGAHGPVASTGAAVFHTYYKTALQRILKPFFFVRYHLHPVSLPILTKTGIDRLRHTHHRHVQRPSRLARNRLHNPHALRQARHRLVACPPRCVVAKSQDPKTFAIDSEISSFVRGDLTFQESIEGQAEVRCTSRARRNGAEPGSCKPESRPRNTENTANRSASPNIHADVHDHPIASLATSSQDQQTPFPLPSSHARHRHDCTRRNWLLDRIASRNNWPLLPFW